MIKFSSDGLTMVTYSKASDQPCWMLDHHRSLLFAFKWAALFRMSVASDVVVRMDCSYPSSRVELLWYGIWTWGGGSYILSVVLLVASVVHAVCQRCDVVMIFLFVWWALQCYLEPSGTWLVGNQEFCTGESSCYRSAK